MCCKKNEKMIIGMSIRTEIRHIRGDGFAKFTVLNEKLFFGFVLSGKTLTTIQTTTRPDHTWPEVWTKIGKAAQNREKTGMGKREAEARLDNARRLRGIYFVGPDDREHSEILKMQEENWKDLWVPRCRAKDSQAL